MTRRGALHAIKSVALLNLPPAQLRDAKLLCAARAKSTSVIHNHVVNHFVNFLRKRGYDCEQMRYESEAEAEAEVEAEKAPEKTKKEPAPERTDKAA